MTKQLFKNVASNKISYKIVRSVFCTCALQSVHTDCDLCVNKTGRICS